MSKLSAYLAASGFLVLLVAAWSTTEKTLGAPPSQDTDWSKADTMTVKLSDFEFSPAYLGLRVGTPVRLVLVNEGSGEHDFSAPEFFSAVIYRPGSMVPAEGRIEVPKNETKEVDLLPLTAGSYKLKCTEFLHSLFGMRGTIEVTGEPR